MSPGQEIHENEVYDIPMKDIFADEDFNSRGMINPIDVVDLAKDIKINGLLAPVLVQLWNKDGRRFRLVAGYRRYKAHQVNGAELIKALVRQNLTDLEARVLNLSENLHRENLDPLQEAKAIEHFKNAGWTGHEIANKIKKSYGWVQVRAMILELPEEVQQEVKAGILKQEEIRRCWQLKEPSLQIDYVRRVKDKNLMGKKRDIDPEKIKQKNEARLRNAREINELQDLIIECLGATHIANKVLAWACGEIDTNKVYEALEKESNGRFVRPELVG